MGPPTFEGFFIPLTDIFTTMYFAAISLVFELINYSTYGTMTLINLFVTANMNLYLSYIAQKNSLRGF